MLVQAFRPAVRPCRRRSNRCRGSGSTGRRPRRSPRPRGPRCRRPRRRRHGVDGVLGVGDRVGRLVLGVGGLVSGLVLGVDGLVLELARLLDGGVLDVDGLVLRGTGEVTDLLRHRLRRGVGARGRPRVGALVALAPRHDRGTGRERAEEQDPLALAALLGDGVALEHGVGVGRAVGGLGGRLLRGGGTGGDRRDGARELGQDVLDERLAGVLDLGGEGLGRLVGVLADRLGRLARDVGGVGRLLLGDGGTGGRGRRGLAGLHLELGGLVGSGLCAVADLLGAGRNGVLGLLGPGRCAEHVSSSCWTLVLDPILPCLQASTPSGVCGITSRRPLAT